MIIMLRRLVEESNHVQHLFVCCGFYYFTCYTKLAEKQMHTHIAFSLKKKYNIPKLYRISGKDLRRSEYKFRWLPVLRGRKKTERSSSFWHWIWNFVIGFSGKKHFSLMRLVITFISCGMLYYIMRFSRLLRLDVSINQNFQEFILKDKWMVNF